MQATGLFGIVVSCGMSFVPAPLLGRYLIRLFFGLLVLALLAVTSLFLLMNGRYMRSAIDGIVGFSQETLSEKSRHAEFIMKQLVSFAVDLYYSSAASEYLLGVDGSDLAKHDLTSLLRERKNANTIMHSVYVYNDEFGLAGSDPSYISLEIGGLDIMDRLSVGTTSRFEIYPGRFVRSPDSAMEPLISFVYTHLATGDRPPSHAIVVNIYEEAFATQMVDIADRGDQRFLIADASGVVLSHTDKAQIASSVPTEWQPPAGSEEYGWLRISDEARDELVIFRRNDVLQWSLFHVMPYAGILGSAREVQRDSVIALALTVVVCLILAFIVSRQLYRPIFALLQTVSTNRRLADYNRFRNEIQFIRDNFLQVTERGEQDRHLMRREFLRNLMLADLSEETIETAMRRLRDELPSDPSWVVLFSLDGDGALSEEDESLMHFFLSSEIDARLDPAQVDVIPISGNVVANLVSGSSSHSSLLAACTALGSDFARRTHLSVSAAIAGPVEGIRSARDAYLNAERYLHHRILTGPGCVHTQESVQRGNETVFEYPEEMEKSIVAALKVGNRREFRSEVAELLEYGRRYDYRRFSYLVIQVALALIKQMSITSGDSGEGVTDFESLVLQFRLVRSLGDIEGLFAGLYDHYRQLLQELSDAGHQQRHIIDQAKRYVEQELESPLLSIETIAAHVSYSAGHLSRLFKASEGETLSDYVTRIRFNRARELLVATDMNIADIAESVGFYNVNYFYTAFKRSVGVTPAVYRTANQRRDRHEATGA